MWRPIVAALARGFVIGVLMLSGFLSFGAFASEERRLVSSIWFRVPVADPQGDLTELRFPAQSVLPGFGFGAMTIRLYLGRGVRYRECAVSGVETLSAFRSVQALVYPVNAHH